MKCEDKEIIYTQNTHLPLTEGYDHLQQSTNKKFHFRFHVHLIGSREVLPLTRECVYTQITIAVQSLRIM